MKWRTGRHNGHVIYLQAGDEPVQSDECVGHMHSDEAAARVVEAVNRIFFDG